jgi:hypothetical protein
MYAYIIFAVPGDCGSWVVDADSAEIYGHVVAGNTPLRRAYFIAAADVVQDIQANLPFPAQVVIPVRETKTQSRKYLWKL